MYICQRCGKLFRQKSKKVKHENKLNPCKKVTPEEYAKKNNCVILNKPEPFTREEAEYVLEFIVKLIKEREKDKTET
jgi:hypothetical protein